jgi:hypothetical protein
LHNLHKNNVAPSLCGLEEDLVGHPYRSGVSWEVKGLPVTMHLTIFGMTILKKRTMYN